MKRVLIFVFCLIAFGLVAQVIYQPHRRNAFRSKGAFQPSDVAGLIMWYDANSIGSPTNVNGYLVTNWYDRSVSGYTLRNVGLNVHGLPYQPYYTNNVSELGGKPWLNFGPTNYLMHFNTTVYSQPNTTFIVVKGGNSALTEVACDGTNNSTRSSINYVVTTHLLSINSGSSLTTDGALVVNKWYLIEATYNGASSSIITNGVSAKTGNAGTASLSGFVVGSRDSHDQNYLLGGIAEVLVYNANVASGDRTSIRSYFTNKYGPYANW